MRRRADMGVKYVSRSKVIAQRESLNKRIIFGVVLFIPAILFLAVMQTSVLTIFGKPPGVVLLFTCATGMLFGEREGGVSGVFGGFIIDCIGGGLFSLSPLFFMLCGYFSGVCSKYVLSHNLPSFWVYALVVGILKELANIFYFGMSSANLNLFEVLTNTLLPDYFAFVICSPFIYIIVYILKKIIFYKRNKREKI